MRGATMLRVVGCLGLAAGIVGGSSQLVAGQSQSPPASPSPSESPSPPASAPASPVMPTPGGPIAWTIETKDKDFAAAWFFNGIAQAVDGLNTLIDYATSSILLRATAAPSTLARPMHELGTGEQRRRFERGR